MSLGRTPTCTRWTVKIGGTGGIGICRLTSAVACGREFEGATAAKRAAGTIADETSNEFLWYPMKQRY